MVVVVLIFSLVIELKVTLLLLFLSFLAVIASIFISLIQEMICKDVVLMG